VFVGSATRICNLHLPNVARSVFVNRSLRLDKITWFGFDMDYTLAEYLHPQYDEMIYEFAKQRLVDQGYPKSLLALKYEHEFAIRCLFIDTKLGNVLKISALCARDRVCGVSSRNRQIRRGVAVYAWSRVVEQGRVGSNLSSIASEQWCVT
jgi:hypothetical protein